MSDFSNVTYDYYSTTLGRSIVPEADFNALKLENISEMSRLLPWIVEREENGIDKAVCLMIEVQYIDEQVSQGKTADSIVSETVGGHSVSYGTTAKTKLEELNAKSTRAKKIDRIKWFCDLNIGVC